MMEIVKMMGWGRKIIDKTTGDYCECDRQWWWQVNRNDGHFLETVACREAPPWEPFWINYYQFTSDDDDESDNEHDGGGDKHGGGGEEHGGRDEHDGGGEEHVLNDIFTWAEISKAVEAGTFPLLGLGGLQENKGSWKIELKYSSSKYTF